MVSSRQDTTVHERVIATRLIASSLGFLLLPALNRGHISYVGPKVHYGG